MFSTVLIANRGEIACRVIATLKRLGLATVAIYSEPDADATHVALADQAFCLGPAAAARSYMNIEAVIDAAVVSGAQAIHPGYGFLSENVAFARACAAAEITFIGPGEHALEVMGDKIRSKNHVAAAGVPLVEGISEPGLSDDQLVAAAAGMSFPVLIKPSAGGGGKGMHVVERHEELAGTLPTARRVAKAAFGDDTLFIEQLVRSPRHIEVQVLADAHGNVIHLGERECSLQRRHQKVIEEAPSALLSEATRQRIGDAACDTARSVDYRGAGTVEFLVSDQDPSTFYFMEMNTRLQVEHPVTEEITGIDLVEQQLRIADGQPLELRQEDIRSCGHSVEARIYAEDPQADFLPSAGTVLGLSEPSGPGIRVDSSMYEGLVVGADYDPMLAKVIATGADREQAFDRLHRALGETVVHGLITNTVYLQQLAADPEVRAGHMDTTMIERKLPRLRFPEPQRHHGLAAVLFLAHRSIANSNRLRRTRLPPSGHQIQGPQAWQLDGWRQGRNEAPVFDVIWTRGGSGARHYQFRLDATSTLVAGPASGQYLLHTPNRSIPVHITAGAVSDQGAQIWVSAEGFSGALTVVDDRARTHRQLAQIEAELVVAAPEITAPMPGTVVAVDVGSGDWVEAGERMVTIEAMKMEHRLTAQTAGTARINVALGDQVSLGQVLATVDPPAETVLKDNS